MNEYSSIAPLKAPINRLSQASKIDIPTCYIICQEVLKTNFYSCGKIFCKVCKSLIFANEFCHQPILKCLRYFFPDKQHLDHRNKSQWTSLYLVLCEIKLLQIKLGLQNVITADYICGFLTFVGYTVEWYRLHGSI